MQFFYCDSVNNSASSPGFVFCGQQDKGNSLICKKVLLKKLGSYWTSSPTLPVPSPHPFPAPSIELDGLLFFSVEGQVRNMACVRAPVVPIYVSSDIRVTVSS